MRLGEGLSLLPDTYMCANRNSYCCTETPCEWRLLLHTMQVSMSICCLHFILLYCGGMLEELLELLLQHLQA